MPLKSAKRSGWEPGFSARVFYDCRIRSSIRTLGFTFSWIVEGRGVDDEVRPVLFVLAAPDDLGVDVPVAARLFIGKPGGAALIGDPNGGLLLLAHDGVEFGRGDVLAPGLLVGDRFYGLFAVLIGHGLSLMEPLP